MPSSVTLIFSFSTTWSNLGLISSNFRGENLNEMEDLVDTWDNVVSRTIAFCHMGEV